MAENETISFREFDRVRAQSIHRKTEIGTLKSELEKLNARIVESDAAYKKLEGEFTKAKTESDKAIAVIEVERDDFRGRLEAAPSELQAENEKLKADIRTRDHKDTYKEISNGLVRPDALDDFWDALKWDATAEAVDKDEMKKAVGTLVEAKPFFRFVDPDGSESGGGAAQSVAPQAKPPGPGSTRGGATPSGPAEPASASFRLA